MFWIHNSLCQVFIAKYWFYVGFDIILCFGKGGVLIPKVLEYHFSGYEILKHEQEGVNTKVC